MQKSETIGELAKALKAFQSDVGAIPKTSTNPFFKSKYAGLPVVIETAGPFLVRHGLAVAQPVDSVDGHDALTTMVMHESGEWISGTTPLHLVKDDPQAHGSALTYMRRYGFMAILGLVADDDDDGNRASGGSRESQSRPQSTNVDSNGELDLRVTAILEAAGKSDDKFLLSLAAQFNERGSLTENQLASGFEKAAKINGGERQFTQRAVANEPPAFEYAPEDERF